MKVSPPPLLFHQSLQLHWFDVGFTRCHHHPDIKVSTLFKYKTETVIVRVFRHRLKSSPKNLLAPFVLLRAQSPPLPWAASPNTALLTGCPTASRSLLLPRRRSLLSLCFSLAAPLSAPSFATPSTLFYADPSFSFGALPPLFFIGGLLVGVKGGEKRLLRRFLQPPPHLFSLGGQTHRSSARA